MLYQFQLYIKVIQLHTHTCIYIHSIFQIIFSYSLSQNIEQSSLCYIVGPCWLSVLYIVVNVHPKAPELSLPPGKDPILALLSPVVNLTISRYNDRLLLSELPLGRMWVGFPAALTNRMYSGASKTKPFFFFHLFLLVGG